MKRAAEEYRDNTTLEPTKKRANFDGAWQKHSGSPECIAWEAQHNCHVNHVKSTGAMEGVKEKNNLIYSEYLGDGDT